MAWTAPTTAVAGDVLPASLWNSDVRDNTKHLYQTSVSTFSPTLTQSGSVTLTTATGRYRHVGFWCDLHIFLNPSGTGTGGNDMVIGNVPAAIAPRSSGAIAGGDADLDVGVGSYHDSGSALYLLHAFFASSSTIKLQHSGATGGSNFGTNPNVAVAAADSINVTMRYETASASA